MNNTSSLIFNCAMACGRKVLHRVTQQAKWSPIDQTDATCKRTISHKHCPFENNGIVVIHRYFCPVQQLAAFAEAIRFKAKIVPLVCSCLQLGPRLSKQQCPTHLALCAAWNAARLNCNDTGSTTFQPLIILPNCIKQQDSACTVSPSIMQDPHEEKGFKHLTIDLREST